MITHSAHSDRVQCHVHLEIRGTELMLTACLLPPPQVGRAKGGSVDCASHCYGRYRYVREGVADHSLVCGGGGCPEAMH